ncbi:MAG: exosortase H [Candidatus Zixiibacteriota bacterium]
MSKSHKKKSVTTQGKQSTPKKAIDKSKRRLYQFLGLFIGLLIVGSIIYPLLSIHFDTQLQGFMAITAKICGTVLGLFTDDIMISDRFVTFDGFSIEVIEECTGLLEMLIFLAALLAYPASWRSKLYGFLAGIPALYIFNVVRIVFLTIVGAHYNSMFDFMHLYFWQATLILMITTVWVLWILLVVNRDKKSVGLFA